MALIIEDGSEVINANSFVTDLEYTTYATAKGLVVAATAELREVDLFAGMDYLASKESYLQGRRVSSTQAVLYPRIGVYIFGYSVASDAIPDNLKRSQMEAAAYSTSGTLLSNTEITNAQTEKLDTLSITYFKGGSTSTVNLQRVNVHLQPLLNDTNSLVRT